MGDTRFEQGQLALECVLGQQYGPQTAAVKSCPVDEQWDSAPVWT